MMSLLPLTFGSGSMIENVPMAERREWLRLWLEQTVRNLVDFPSKSKVYFYEGEQTTVYFIETCQTDTGKIIGKKGQTASSIRDLIGKIAANFGIRAVMEIKDYR